MAEPMILPKQPLLYCKSRLTATVSLFVLVPTCMLTPFVANKTTVDELAPPNMQPRSTPQQGIFLLP
jgi:hypothetical protein